MKRMKQKSTDSHQQDSTAEKPFFGKERERTALSPSPLRPVPFFGSAATLPIQSKLITKRPSFSYVAPAEEQPVQREQSFKETSSAQQQEIQLKPQQKTPLEAILGKKLNYRVAKRLNKKYAKPNFLGWISKLKTVAGGHYKSWASLWKQGKYDDFANAVAQFQHGKNWPKEDVDGVLGLKTWSLIGGLGEAMAGIRKVAWKRSEDICTVATKERIKRGYKLAKGKRFTLPKDKSSNTFNAILQSIPSRMLDIEAQFRGTGAAGALVYSGLGTFVPESDIWDGKLKPGAVIQVWGSSRAYNLLRAGKIKRKGKKRRINSGDANFYGTSLVFVRYDSKNKERILARHYGFDDWVKKSEFKVWIAVNVNSP